jgi:predicted nucleotide-binding protein (sugar kinase/HSP70/actin superfamily)
LGSYHKAWFEGCVAVLKSINTKAGDYRHAFFTLYTVGVAMVSQVVRVGIPRALLYYQYFPMWRTFLEELGAEVVLSPETNREIMAAGLALLVAETCVPVKIFVGHVCWLRDQGVDFVFIPAIHSIEEPAYNCSKFRGLPDVVRATVPGCPPILEADIDVGKGQRALYRAIYELGRPLNPNPLRVKRAAEAALEAHRAYQARLRSGLPLPQAITSSGPGSGSIQVPPQTPDTSNVRLALVGHPYCVYDTYLNHDPLGRLRSLGAQVLTCEMLPQEAVDAAILELMGHKYWTYEGEVLGAGVHYLKDPTVDGVIAIAVFACGPDSTMLPVVARVAKQVGKPFMQLIIDEHSAEAGIVTRLEAFVDMIARRKGQGR